MQYYPSCAQAGVQFGSQLYGFKPGDAVKQPWEMKFGCVAFGIEVHVSAHCSQWFCMVLHGQGQAQRQVCRWSRAFVVGDMAQVFAPVSKLD